MKTLSVADARQRFSALVDEAVKTHQRVHVTRNGKPAVVILSEDDYESIAETIEVLSDPELMSQVRQGHADITAGRVFTEGEIKAITAARADGVELGDEVDVIADMHASGVPDEVCMAALTAIIDRKRA